jgi:hypothetical protein
MTCADDGVVEPYGKKYLTLLTSIALRAGLDFVLDPTAAHRLLEDRDPRHLTDAVRCVPGTYLLATVPTRIGRGRSAAGPSGGA